MGNGGRERALQGPALPEGEAHKFSSFSHCGQGTAERERSTCLLALTSMVPVSDQRESRIPSRCRW